MTRVGFIGAVSKDWMGGLNYYKNLLYALHSVENKTLHPVVFVGKKTDKTIKKMFMEYAEVIEDEMFDRKSFMWYIWKLSYRGFKSTYLINKICVKYDIDLLSHSGMAKLREVKTLNWIPDFQYVHLPEMFSKKELKMRSLSHQYLLKESDAIVLSSYDALKDLKSIAPDRYINKVHVLQFVSQPDDSYAILDNKDDILKKFGIKKDFFYIPNQFWKHKNHRLVFEAIKQLKIERIDICLVCTGHLLDHRNLGYIDEIKVFIEDNQLGENIRLLGLVEYADVFALIKYSKAVINPSLFEGWSSTVEECKSVNKDMILSDLNVHKEQYPQATFFDRYSIDALKEVLVKYKYKKVDNTQYDVKERTSKFAARYVDIVEKVMGVEI